MSQTLEMGLLAAVGIKVPPRLGHASPEADTLLAPSSKNINKMGPNKTGPVGRRIMSVPCCLELRECTPGKLGVSEPPLKGLRQPRLDGMLSGCKEVELCSGSGVIAEQR